MAGIPSTLLRSLRETLRTCREFRSNDELREVFVDELLAPFADELHERDNPPGRVDQLINALWNMQRSDTYENALWLFVLKLRDRTLPGNARYVALDRLAQDLEQVYPAQPPTHSRVLTQANPGNQQMMFTHDVEKLFACMLAVGRITVPQIIRGQVTERFPQGTGWLIAPGLAMTCWHVFAARGALDGRLRESDLATQVANSVMIFDYTLPGKGTEYQIAALECYDKTLDYVLFRLEDRREHPLSNRGFLKPAREGAPLTLQTELYVIQHPKGMPQQSTSGRFVRYIPEQQERILHSAPTEPGSSGAPVLNLANWEVVALHNGENVTYYLREAILLSAILPHIQQTQPDLYQTIIHAH